MAEQAPVQPSETPGRHQRSASWKRSLFFWMLVVLSLLTLGVGVWKWWAGRPIAAAQPGLAPPASATLAPDFGLATTGGAAMHLSDLRGKVVLLNFWATWCPPCKAEMPDLNALYQEFGSDHRFVVLGIDLEESPDAVASFAREQDISFPLLLDRDGEVTSQRYNLRSLPTSMIIDREGKIRDTWSGQLSRATMLARLGKIW
jgi:cytochrome c biogenesis protein CcmG, thiol:disulfide interchange protein DsbE